VVVEKVKQKRWFDVWAVLYILIALFCVASRIKITGWFENLYLLRYLVVIGCLLGLALGYSQFKQKICLWVGVIYTVIIIPWQLVLAMNQEGGIPERLMSAAGALLSALAAFFSNRPVQNPILFFLIIAMIYWLISFFAGYLLTRSANPGIPLLFSAFIIIIVEYYHAYQPGSSFYSVVFIFVSLLLVGRLYFLKSRGNWEKALIKADTEIGFDLGRITLVFTLALILISWNMPHFAQALAPGGTWYERLGNGWSTFNDYISNVVASLSNAPRITIYVYGNTIPLGRGAALGEDIVFTVEVAGKKPLRGRYYWQARNYDLYQEGLWKTTRTDEITYRTEDGTMPSPGWVGRQTVTLRFTPQIPFSAALYYPSVPLSVSRSSKVLVGRNSDNSIDINGITLLKPMRAGESYQVRAWVAAPTANQLLAADRNYPDWVRDRYLQLPDNLPGRITELAQKLILGQVTQYEQVEAVTSYLRTEMTYREIVPESPLNQDPVDWFLFDYKAGFCNYYASAEIVLLRAIGIPARLAVGYAEGETEESRDKFTIREKDSHAWVEVYFSGIGWVEFEPTTNQPVIIYPKEELFDENQPETAVTSPMPTPLRTPTPTQSNSSSSVRFLSSPWFWVISFILIIGIVVFAMRGRIKKWDLMSSIPLRLSRAVEQRGGRSPLWLTKWVSYTKLSPIERLFSRISLIMFLNGWRSTVSQTPSEKINTLTTLIPETKEAAVVLLEEYQQGVYSPRPVNLKRAEKASRQIIITGIRSYFMQYIIIEKK
jgi:transglutaminase-like putative cysteine protease